MTKSTTRIKNYTVVFGTKTVLETDNMKKAFEYMRSFLPRYKEAIIYENDIEIWRGMRA